MNDISIRGSSSADFVFTKPTSYSDQVLEPRVMVSVIFKGDYVLRIVPEIVLLGGDSTCTWLASDPIEVSESSYIDVPFTVDSKNCQTGVYKASVQLSFGTVGPLGKFVLFGKSEPKQVTLRLDANPSAELSSVDVSSCKAIKFGNICSGNVTLRDRDGLEISLAARQTAINQLVTAQLVKVGNPALSRRIGLVNDAATGQLSVTLSAFHGPAYLTVDLRINGTSVPATSPVKVYCASTDPLTGQCTCEAGQAAAEVPVPQSGTSLLTCERCEACKPGQFSTATQGRNCGCQICPEGHFCKDMLSSPVPCPKGSFCPPGTVEPFPCQPDTFGNATGLRECSSCESVLPGSTTLGVAGADAPLFCTKCPPNAVCDVSSKYRRNSTCEMKRYTTAAFGLDGHSPLLFVAYPAAGFYRFPSLEESNMQADDPCASVEFLECLAGVEACPGGNDAAMGSCSKGYDGFGCQGCAEGYTFANHKCLPCNDGQAHIYGALTMVFILAATAVFTFRVFRGELKKMKIELPAAVHSFPGVAKKLDRPILHSDTYVSVMKIAYSHMQIIALLLSLDVDWHRAVTSLEKITAAMSMTSSQVSSSVMCLFDGETVMDGFYLRVVLVFVFPIVATLLFAVTWIVLYLSRWLQPLVKGVREHFNGFQLNSMVLLFLAHLLLLRTALDVMVCTKEKGSEERTFLVADPRIECFTGDHTVWFWAAGIGGLLVYGLGIPALSAFIVHKGSNRYMKSFICKNFRSTHLFWESVVMCRKVLLTIFIISLQKFGARVQGLVSLCILFTALVVQVVHQPFLFRFLNDLETIGLVVSIITLTLALYSLEFDSDIDFDLNILIAFFNVTFLLMIAYQICMIFFNRASHGKVGRGNPRYAPLETFTTEVAQVEKPPSSTATESTTQDECESTAYSSIQSKDLQSQETTSMTMM